MMSTTTTSANSSDPKNKIRVIETQGSPFERGVQHGTACRDDIRRYANERIHLAQQAKWSGHDLTRQAVLDIAHQCIPHHEAYAPDLMQELRGMAQATGLSLAELIVVGGFTDFVDTLYNVYRQEEETTSSPVTPIDDCTAFLVPDQASAADGAFFGQTWDMHDTATEFVILLRVRDTNQPEAIVFTTTGCLGQIGMNQHGVCIGINNLVANDGQIGVTWNFVVRKALQRTTAEEALACVTEAKLAGAHNFMILDRAGNGFNVEATSTRTKITPLQQTPLSHTNHFLFPETLPVAQKRPKGLQESSEKRLKLARELLSQKQRPLTKEDLMAVTRTKPICTHSEPPFHTESCGAVLMHPKTGTFWAVGGLPDENEYEEFSLSSS